MFRTALLALEGRKLSTAQMITWISQFFAAAKSKTGLNPLIYSNPTWWHDCTGNTNNFAAADPLWLADYDVKTPAIPPGWAGFVQPRSGLALRHGVTCLNTPGLIDAGYRDELKVLLVNLDPTEPYEVQRGDRIAQLVLQEVGQAVFRSVDELPPSDRGTGGFGSTGFR